MPAGPHAFFRSSGQFGPQQFILCWPAGPVAFRSVANACTRVVEFANTFDLVIANTWFTRNQLITFKSGNSESQIDYILTNRRHLNDIINCNTMPGEAVVSQHTLVVMDLRTRTKKKRQYRRENEVKIKWWRLKDQAVADDYAKDVINNMENCEEPEWTIFSETMKAKGSEHCGVTTGGKSMQKRETWWWNTTVQEAIARKKGDV